MSILLATFILGGFFVFFGISWDHESARTIKETCHE